MSDKSSQDNKKITKQKKNLSEPDQLDLFAPAKPTQPTPQPVSRSRRTPVGPQPLPPELEPVAAALPQAIRLGTSSWSFHG